MSEQPLRRLPRFKPRSGIQVMYASIRALFLRELQTRFGHYRIGYVWALIEPALNVIFMLILFGAIVKRTLPGIEYPVFLINGILPFFVFKKAAMQSLSAITSNKGLLSYRSVKPIDTVIARTLLEFILYFVCYILLSSVLIWIGYQISFSHIPELLFLWSILLLISLGFGAIMMVIGSYSPEINKALGPMFLILYFMSGAIFPLHRVPEQYLGYFLWNPLAHLFELLRHAAVPTYSMVSSSISLSYVLVCTMGVMFIGLLLYRASTENMLKSK